MNDAGNNPGNTPGISQGDRLRNAAAVQSLRNSERLQVDNAGQSEHADLEQSDFPVQNNPGSGLESEPTFSRADSVSSIESGNSSIPGKSGDKTHRELSVLLNSVKQSMTTSNDRDTVTQPPVEPINKDAESIKLASSLKKESSRSIADGPKHESVVDLRLSNSKEKEEEKATIEEFVKRNPDYVTQLTTNLSITRKSSGSNEPKTPRAESKPITPDMVDQARETLKISISKIDETNSEKFQLAGIGMSIEEVKAIIAIDKSDASALQNNETIKTNPGLLKSFGTILRQPSKA
jgi:hypothetical protein